MHNTRLAGRYAKSLIDIALEQKVLEEVYKDMQFLQQLMSASRELSVFLKSPVVSVEKKQSALKVITEGKISKLSSTFIHLLISKHREAELGDIITAFIAQYKQHNHIQILKLTTATPVSEEIKKQLIERVKQTGSFQNIELEEKVDPSIIGGFVLQAGDKLVDASIAYDLKEVGKQFKNNDFIYKII